MRLNRVKCLSPILNLVTDPSLPFTPSAACIQPYSARRDAFDESFPLEECENQGHCYDPAPDFLPSVPWCYFRADDDGEALVASCEATSASGSRRDCATTGDANPHSCTARGCCWAPGDDGEPWCFWPDTVDYESEEAFIAEGEASNSEL